jgi:hypothetical protein
VIDIKEQIPCSSRNPHVGENAQAGVKQIDELSVQSFRLRCDRLIQTGCDHVWPASQNNVIRFSEVHARDLARQPRQLANLIGPFLAICKRCGASLIIHKRSLADGEFSRGQ